MALIRAVAGRDGAEASRLLAASPDLARQALGVGASRQEASTYFLDVITHHVYAGDTALHVAAAAYQPGTAAELLAGGADPRARNRRGAEPIHYAADGAPGSQSWDPGAQAAVIDCLIAAGADPNCADKSGVSPLHRAVRTRCSSAVKALLTHGAEARRPNDSGATPLHLAVQGTGRGGTGSSEARTEQEAILHLLLEHGARPTDKDARGKTVRESAVDAWIHDILEAHR